MLLNILLQSLSFQELLTIMLSALGCGLLIGLERERHKNNNNEQSFAGLRSFTITALLGASCFLLHLYIGVIGTVAVSLFCVYSLFQQKQDIGSTTELAFLMTYIIGAICVEYPTCCRDGGSTHDYPDGQTDTASICRKNDPKL